MREFTKCLELLAFELKRFSLIENEQHRNRCTAYTEAMRLVELLSDLLPLLSRQAIAGNIEGAAALPERLSDVEHCLGQVRLELRKRPDGAYGGRPWTSGPLPAIASALPRELLRLAKAFKPPEVWLEQKAVQEGLGLSHSEQVGRLCKKELKTNGKTGKAKRIALSSVLAYCPEFDLDAGDPLPEEIRKRCEALREFRS